MDSEVIQSIPMGVVRDDDCLCWHYDRRGKYTVKSGYFVAMQALIWLTVQRGVQIVSGRSYCGT